MNSAVKNVIFWLVMAVTALLIWAVVKSSPSQPVREMSFTQFSREVAQDNVLEVTISESANSGIFVVKGALKKGNVAFKTAAPASYAGWIEALTEKNAEVTFEPSESSGWFNWIANGLPMLLILGLWIFIMRKMQGTGRNLRSWSEAVKAQGGAPPGTPD